MMHYFTMTENSEKYPYKTELALKNYICPTHSTFIINVKSVGDCIQKVK